MALPGHYDFARVRVLMNAHLVTGFGEGDGLITFERPAAASYNAGADGRVQVSRSNQKWMTCTITVQETSYSYRVLAELQRAQDNSLVPGFPFVMSCGTTGDKVTDLKAYFLEGSAPNKGAEAGTRTFVILLPNGVPGYIAGGALVAG